MDKKWKHRGSELVIVKLISILYCASIAKSCGTEQEVRDESVLDRELKNYVDRVFSVGEFRIVPGIEIERAGNQTYIRDGSDNNRNDCERGRNYETVQEYAGKKLNHYAQTHVLSVNLQETARFLSSGTDGGKSSFLTGFGMGFLAFALKKLLLPVFIGAQLIKSVLIAMFLPSILGGLGKLVGKGLSTFSGVSGASAGINNNNQYNQLEDFEFKDTDPYNNDAAADYSADASAINQLGVDGDGSTVSPSNSRFGVVNQRVSYISPQHNDNYYMRRPNKKTDYKVFHKIPPSSLLLTSYDPFYSPLLSRLDAVFQQLGLGNDKSPQTERCRERLVCLMYANPAKYAPYSNLVSAQLSRELNELRKPSSDNPDILRFFRYMKAAKDGQDGEECHAHGGCPSLTAQQPSPAMLTTFNDINKLVLARKFN
ncbi:uncharacterized protein LOC108905934 [Anoplophora glabripennis]|uniref:uncharacterized protein LOC108905934 n=1 Tax=Anoplophora glabripennis TaxID=217634 RepID=UPI000C78EF71|nr:uncharacterized protein LOC108905934 [Anoplophora glabripennis]